MRQKNNRPKKLLEFAICAPLRAVWQYTGKVDTTVLALAIKTHTLKTLVGLYVSFLLIFFTPDITALCNLTYYYPLTLR